jgi:hypothetical protein
MSDWSMVASQSIRAACVDTAETTLQRNCPLISMALRESVLFIIVCSDVGGAGLSC